MRAGGRAEPRLFFSRLWRGSARPGGAPFVLKTAFPNQVVADESVTLAAANLLNAVLIQTLKTA